MIVSTIISLSAGCNEFLCFDIMGTKHNSSKITKIMDLSIMHMAWLKKITQGQTKYCLKHFKYGMVDYSTFLLSRVMFVLSDSVPFCAGRLCSMYFPSYWDWKYVRVLLMYSDMDYIPRKVIHFSSFGFFWITFAKQYIFCDELCLFLLIF